MHVAERKGRFFVNTGDLARSDGLPGLCSHYITGQGPSRNWLYIEKGYQVIVSSFETLFSPQFCHCDAASGASILFARYCNNHSIMNAHHLAFSKLGAKWG